MRGRKFNWRLHAVGLTMALSILEPRLALGQDFVSGMHWMKECSGTSTLGIHTCDAIMLGISGFHNLEEVPALYCAPKGVKFPQAKAVVLKYLKDNPARLHLPFVRLAVDALKAAWPCSKAN